MYKRQAILSTMFAVTLLAGCGGERGVRPEAAEVEERGVRTAAVEDYGVYGRPISQLSREELLAIRQIYFAFDSSVIDDDGRTIIEAHASYLAENPGVKVLLEGHADERGTREYNLALGERRAGAVARLAEVLGVAPGRIRTVSYGEEKPAALGHDESAWRLNRRVEIIYDR